MDKVALELLVWIAANSSYAVGDAKPPPVVPMTREDFAALLVKDAPDGVENYKGAELRIYAYYKRDEGPAGTIYVVRPEETPGAAAHAAEPAANPIFRERLLHELVHFAQHVTGRMDSYRCPSLAEVDAYRLGWVYLKQRNVPDPLPFRRQLMLSVLRC